MLVANCTGPLIAGGVRLASALAWNAGALSTGRPEVPQAATTALLESHRLDSGAQDSDGLSGTR